MKIEWNSWTQTAAIATTTKKPLEIIIRFCIWFAKGIELLSIWYDVVVSAQHENWNGIIVSQSCDAVVEFSSAMIVHIWMATGENILNDGGS